MKILLCSHEMSYTGAPRSLFFMCGVLKEMGHEIRVWSLKDGPFADQFCDLGYPVKIIDFPDEDSDQWKTEIASQDLVIANTAFSASFARYAGQYAKVILWLREAENLPQLVRDCNLNEEDIIKAKHIVCVSEYAKQAVRSVYPVSDVKVVPNFIPDRGRESLNLVRNQKIKFIVSGTVEERKQQNVAFEAYLMMPQALRKMCELHIVGGRPDWAKAYWKPLRNNLQDGIIWHEEIEDDRELFRLYEQMNVFLVPSLDEACSLTALEGAMLGKALLVSEHVGAKYLISDKDFVFPCGDIPGLSGKMCALTSRKKLLLQGIRMRRAYLCKGTKKSYEKALRNILNNM